MATHATADFYAAVDPVVNREFYGLEADREPSQFDKIFKISSTDEPQKSAVEYGGPLQLDLKAENAAVAGKSIVQGPIKGWTTNTHAANMVLSFEAVADVKYAKIKSAAGSIGRATRQTPEYIARDFLDRAFNSAYPQTAWSLELCSDVHKLPDGVTTTSNELATPAALDETSVEDIMTLGRNILAPDGGRGPERVKQIIVPTALWVVAEKLSMNPKTSGSAFNDPSVIKGFKVQVFDYLTSNTRWFAQTHNSDGLFWDWIQKAQFITDQVPLNLQKVYIAYFRSRIGCVNFRGILGSAAS